MQTSSHLRARLASMLTLHALVAAGCGEADVAPTVAAPDLPEQEPCRQGHIAGPDGDCMPVGIQGCADLFMGDDGLCHPSISLCPRGQIPSLEEGCVAVGIPGCAEEFIEEDGLCHPSMAKCPEGTFALPQEGCVAVDGPDGPRATERRHPTA